MTKEFFGNCALGIGLVALLAGCATTAPVFTDFDPDQDFSTYRSFAWISDHPMIVAGDRGPNAMDEQRLIDAIEGALQQKGYRMVDDAEGADFVVAFTVGARDRFDVRTRQVVDYYGPHWRWGYRYYGFAYPVTPTRTEVTTRRYAEGSLSIDVFDAERKSPVWHGNATKRLSPGELRGGNAAAIKNAVETILADFPPQ